MLDTTELLQLAARLGEGLASHPSVAAYHEARRAARADKSAQELLRSYQEQLAHLQQLEAARKPVEVSDKQKLKNFELAMASNESLKALMRTQADYASLMNSVNEAMEGPILRLDAEQGT